MKWRAPSERTQMWLAAPIAVPIAFLVMPIALVMAVVLWLTDKLKPAYEWHRWFAWRPVPLDHWSDHIGKRGGWAWLETVERRARPHSWPTEYRAALGGHHDR